MKVKIGDTTYDSSEQPIMLILNVGEREQIANMPRESKGKYCQAPDSVSESELLNFMEEAVPT